MSDVDWLECALRIALCAAILRKARGTDAAKIAVMAATAEIYLQGATMLRDGSRRTRRSVLFMSARGHFSAGSRSRWLCRWCFPWFAARTGGRLGRRMARADAVVGICGRRIAGKTGVRSLQRFRTRPRANLGFDHLCSVSRSGCGSTLRPILEWRMSRQSRWTFESAAAYYSVSDLRQIDVSGLGTRTIPRPCGQRKAEHQGVGVDSLRGETDQLHLIHILLLSISDPD